MAKPHFRVSSVTIGAAHPRALAGFYAELLGWPVVDEDPPAPGAPPDGGWTQLRPPAGEVGPTLNFERDREYVPPVWPSVAGAQQTMEHLDIEVEELDGAVGWAVGKGATLPEFQPQQSVRVLLDPEGHPFCLWTRE